MIDDFITDICELLKINKPSISYDTSHFSSDTMMAQCDSSGTTIYLRKKDKPDPDYFFAIAHELRHIWQIQFAYDDYLSDYQTVNSLGTEKYNNQLSEIDANAFASIVMIDYFHVRPLFQGMSTYTIGLINSRMDLIANQLVE